MSSLKLNKSKIDRLRDSFYFDDNGRPDIYTFGTYRQGLTSAEIEIYLQVRAGRIGAKKLSKQFNKLFWCGTATGATCEICRKSISLIYRRDVERFADVMFEGRTTYFD